MELHWDDLRVLLALLRERTLAGAARSLEADRSTLSRRLASLERALGARLFLRTREGLRPSAAAERLRPHAEQIEREVRALTAAARAQVEGATGVVRVATTEALGTFLVQKGLLELGREHPDVVVDLLCGNRPVDLGRGEADLALRVIPLKDAAVQVRCIARMGFGLYGAAEYLRARGVPRGEDGLAGHDVLVPGGELAPLPEAKWLSARPGARVVFQSNSMPALVAACVAGHGLAVLPRPWGAVEPALELALPLDRIPRRPLWLAVQPDVAKRPAVRVVAERLGALAARFARA